jgi:hypothetical protein
MAIPQEYFKRCAWVDTESTEFHVDDSSLKVSDKPGLQNNRVDSEIW